MSERVAEHHGGIPVVIVHTTAVPVTESRQTNRSLGERCHEAMLAHAKAQSEAMRAERLRKRKFAELFLRMTEGSVAQREAMARTSPAYVEAENLWVQAESAANLAKAEADGMRIRFEEYRTREATTRAEMQMR